VSSVPGGWLHPTANTISAPPKFKNRKWLRPAAAAEAKMNFKNSRRSIRFFAIVSLL
jgi:hypothetical protein